MTDPVTTTAGAATVALATAIWAVIDPAITSIALAVVAVIAVFLPLWFKYKTDVLLHSKLKEQDIKIEGVIKNSDGMKSELVKATADASLAKGIAQGVAQAESKAIAKAADKAEGALEQQAKGQQAKQVEGRTEGASAPADSGLLPTQSQPIAVEHVKGVKLTEDQLGKMIRELEAEKSKINPVKPKTP